MRKVGLFVGISKYADEDITPLVGAANDAIQLAGLFQRNLGFETHVVTHEQLLAGEEFLKEKVVDLTEPLGADDLFVFYFAGHGRSLKNKADAALPPQVSHADQDQSAPAPPKDQLFLLPKARLARVNAGKHDVGVITLQFLHDNTDRPGLRRAFVFDACRDEIELAKADTRSGQSDFAFEGEVVFRNLVFAKTALRGGALPPVILNSCRNAQHAVELRSRGRGLFSLALDELISDLVSRSQPVVLNDRLVDNLTQRMRTLLPASAQIGLRPCLNARSDMSLFDPATAVVARPDNRQARLLKLFEEQLAGDQTDAPAGLCARDTFTQLAMLGTIDDAVLNDLSSRLQAAVDRVHDAKLIQRARRTGLAADYDTYLAESRLREHVADAEAALAAATSDAAETDEDDEDKATDEAAPITQPIFTPSRALAAIVGNGPLPRTEVTGRLWEHIKTHNLQDPNDKRIIVTDAMLARVCDGRERVSMFDLTGCVNKNLEPAVKLTVSDSQRLASGEAAMTGVQDDGGATSAAKHMELILASRPRQVLVCVGLSAAYSLGLVVYAVAQAKQLRDLIDPGAMLGLILLVVLPAVACLLIWQGRAKAYLLSIFFLVLTSPIVAVCLAVLLWHPTARKWFADVAAARAVVKREAERRRSVETP